MRDEQETSGAVLGTGRLEAFSDGVMAVIITIMAFELRAPAGSSWASLDRRLPALAVYALSFTFIGIYWVNHHHLLRSAQRVSPAVMWSNLVLLFCLSLIPVATEWVANDYSHALPAAVYGTVAFASGISYTLLGAAIVKVEGRGSVLGAIVGNRKIPATMTLLVVSVAVAFVAWPVSYALYVVVAGIWFIPDSRIAAPLSAASTQPDRPSLTDPA